MTTTMRRWFGVLALALGLLVATSALTACGPSASGGVTQGVAVSGTPTTTSTSTPTRASTSSHSATSGPTDPASGLPWIDESALPTQAAHTLAEIRAGGPYDYPGRDDVTYHNNNRVLPTEPDGYYREYTVKTPGSSTRGARRIIRGNGGELYWTADHYNTFERIREHQ